MDALDYSLHWESGSDIEWSIDIESKFFIETLGLSLCLLVKVKDLPFLSLRIDLGMKNDFLTFNIFLLIHMETLVILNIDKSVYLILENLVPLRVG
jgi:hypothetical protein